MSKIPVTGWYLENRNGSHNKFYTVLIADNGVVVMNWGPIGKTGQTKIQKLPFVDAEALGKRQLYSKQTTGYTLLTDELKFTIDEDDLDTACRQSNPLNLIFAFNDARSNPEHQGDKQVVMKHYDDFIDKAQELMGSVGARPLDELLGEMERLESSWREISDKHDSAAATLSLSKQMLSQRLMAGVA